MSDPANPEPDPEWLDQFVQNLYQAQYEVDLLMEMLHLEACDAQVTGDHQEQAWTWIMNARG